MDAFAFLRPALLWGLLGVALPILIHLLGRRRVRTVPIGTLRFLEKARARASSRWRLRRILLLLARAAALACLALLFAGPGCRVRGIGTGGGAWVLLLDTSPSMASSRGAVSCLERAKQELLRLLDAADPTDRFLFVTTRPGEEVRWRQGFSADASAIRKQIREAAVEHGEHRMDRALERAFRLVEGTPGARVAFATDLQASNWGEGLVPGAGKLPLEILDAGFPDPRNAWVSSVDETPAGAVRARLSSAGPGEGGQRRTVRLRLDDGQKAAAFVTGAEASFQIRQPAADYEGVVQLEPGGDLGLDDEFSFIGKGRDRVRVLFVNGDPRGFEIRDELFFLRKALSPGGRLGEAFDVREVRAADLSPKELEGVQVVFLANPGPLSGAIVSALRSAAEKGAGVVVTAGDRWQAGEGAGALAPLLAAPLRDVITLAGSDPSRRPYEPVDPDFFQPPLEGFRDRSFGDLSKTRVWTYWALDRASAGGGQTWMRLENGAPLLVQRGLGKGTSLLLATTIDRDWADLCLQPAFIPWIERILLYSAGRLNPRVGSRVVAGVPMSLPYQEPVTVQGPKGFREDWRPASVPFVPPEPGVYRVRSGERPVDAFAAGIAPAESDLTRLSAAGLDGRLGKGAYQWGAKGAPAASEAVGRKDASGRFAALLLALLLAEAILSSRFSRRPVKTVVRDG